MTLAAPVVWQFPCGCKSETPKGECCGLATAVPSNVLRAAEDSTALNDRANAAGPSIHATALALQNDLRVAVNMKGSTFLHIVSEDEGAIVNVHDLIRSRQRRPDHVKLKKRRAVEAKIFGDQAEQIVYGALYLEGRGVHSYGRVCVTLKSDEIKHKVSFLEKNSYSYWNDGDVSVPRGSRALISTAGVLCALKHRESIRPDTKWPEVIIQSNGSKSGDDYIEAQIADTVTWSAFEGVCVAQESDEAIRPPKGTTRAEQSIPRVAELCQRVALQVFARKQKQLKVVFLADKGGR